MLLLLFILSLIRLGSVIGSIRLTDGGATTFGFDQSVVLELRSGPVYAPKGSEGTNYFTNEIDGYKRRLNGRDRRRLAMLRAERGTGLGLDKVKTRSAEWGWLQDAKQALVGCQRHSDELIDHVERHGCHVSGYLGNCSLLVVGPHEALEKALQHEHVEWSLPYEAEHKIAPEWKRVLNAVEERLASAHAQNVTMRGYGHLPIDVLYSEDGEALFGVRAVFPSLQKPRPHHPKHDRYGIQNERIDRWHKNVATGYHGGIAAVKDWRDELAKAFSVAHVRDNGKHAVTLYVPGNEIQKAIDWLADRHAVHWVEPMPRLRMLNRQASTITQSGRSAPFSGVINTDPEYHPIWSAGITGKNMVVGIGDSGLDYEHCFFADPDTEWSANIVTEGDVLTFTSTTHRKIRLYRAFADFRDDNGHGTHTCGTLAGMPYGNTLAETSGENIGMAPDAKLAFVDLSSARDGDRIVTPRDLANQYFRYTTDVGATVHSDSWGSTSIFYDYEALQIDAFCWENPTFLPVFPAGNDGDRATYNGNSGTSTVNSPATAKNCLAVGATQTAGTTAQNIGLFTTYTGSIQINGVAGYSFPVLLSSFSPGFGELSNSQYALVISNPMDGCSAFQNSGDVIGKIVLIERGTCEFVEKAQNAELAGAAGVIIYDNVAGAYFIPDTAGGTVNIPTGFIPRRIGQNLVAEINSGQSLSISFGPSPKGDIGYENLAEFSSQGPVQPDRRVKPDILAPGIVASAKAGTSCGTSIFAGTSMATPVAAGNAVLVQQYFKDGFYPGGFPIAENGFMPSSALVKAVMMGGAKQIGGYEADTGLPIDPAPSFRQGYGRVYLGGSLMVENNPYNPKGFQVLDSVDITDGDKHLYCIRSTGGPLSITVAWTDLPGNPSAPKSLVNNIDLVVRSEGYNGIPALGNGGDIDDSTKPDTVNNVEQVRFSYLPAGRVSIEVLGAGIYSQNYGPQPYAIAVIGDFEGTLVSPSEGSGECPVISATIISGPAPLTNEDVATFEFGLGTGISNGVSFECKLEVVQDGSPVNQAWAPCTSPQSYQGLNDGEYSFSVRPVNENSVANQIFVVDKTPPVLETSQVEVPRGSAKFRISTNDLTEVFTQCMLTGENLSGAQGRVLGGEIVASPIVLNQWFNCSDGVTVGWMLPGQWNFVIKAIDQAGNASPLSDNPINIPTDPTYPVVYIQEGPFMTIPKSEVAFRTLNLVGGSQEVSQQLECSLVRWPSDLENPGVPQQWEPCSGYQEYGVIDNGKYTFFSRIVGAPVESAALATFTVDEIAPTVNVVGSSGIFSTPVATFQFELSEPGETECKLVGVDSPDDSMDWTPCIGPVQFRNLTGGRYVLEVAATDPVGNRGNSTIFDFIVDLDSPVVNVDYQQGTREPSMTVTFTVDDGPQGSGIANVTCQVVPIKLVGQQIEKDSERWAPKPCESPWTFGLEEGEWQISVTATDNAGRVSNQEPIRVWMDTVPPTATITSGPSKDQVNSGGTVTFNITDTDVENGGSPVLWQGYLSLDADTVAEQEPVTADIPTGDAAVKSLKEHTIKSNDQNVLGKSDLGQWANCSSTSCTYAGLAQGTYTFRAKGVDAAGNEGEPSAPYTFKLEGSSSGLPTWALIVIIVGSCVVGILLLAVLWCCCCRSKKKPPPHMNGATYPYNGNTNGHAFTSHYATNGHAANGHAANGHAANGYAANGYTNGASYPVAGARPFAGAVDIPQDPVAAQAAALNRYNQPSGDDDADLRRAIEASKRESRQPITIAPVEDDLDLAIAMSLSENNPAPNRY